MASLRKAGAYSKKYARPNTRKSKKRTKSFIKTVPPMKLAKFNMGNIKARKAGKFDIAVKLLSTEKVQIRDVALESVRQTLTRNLEKKIPGQAYIEVKVYPHHILRENKMLTGAGSDRMQTGMQKSFGKVIGRAAMVKPNQTIFLIETTGEKGVRAVRETIKIARPKLPCKVKIVIEKIEKKTT